MGTFWSCDHSSYFENVGEHHMKKLIMLLAICTVGCAGAPYLEVKGDYDWIDHNGDVTFSEGPGIRVEGGWDFGPVELGAYHFSHPFSHRNEVAVNGLAFGGRIGGVK